MKKAAKLAIQKIISTRGLLLIRKYELEHVKNKYSEVVREISNHLIETTFPELKIDKKELFLLEGLYGTTVSEAHYIMHYLRDAIQNNGDVAEFGVGNGSTSALLAYQLKKTNKRLFLFDSFQGLSKPTEKDVLINDMFQLGGMDKYQGTMSYTQNEVKGRIRPVGFPLSRLKLIPGFIQDSLNRKSLPSVLCFAYVDFDLYEPTKIALGFLRKVLIKGGYIIVDDYGYFSAGVKTAVDEFIFENNKKYKLLLPKKSAGHFCIIIKK